jgi:Protein of unknown function (DUF992)
MKRILPALALTAAGVIGSSQAFAVDRVEIGILDCTVAGGSGFIFGSTKDLSCTFNPADGGRAEETYTGSIKKFGVDIGKTEQGVIKWGVLAPTQDDYPPGALAGNYGGVSGEATVGVGVGANALVGGSSETIVLQPISVQVQEGLNIALGIAQLQLNATTD